MKGEKVMSEKRLMEEELREIAGGVLEETDGGRDFEKSYRRLAVSFQSAINNIPDLEARKIKIEKLQRLLDMYRNEHGLHRRIILSLKGQFRYE